MENSKKNIKMGHKNNPLIQRTQNLTTEIGKQISLPEFIRSCLFIKLENNWLIFQWR